MTDPVKPDSLAILCKGKLRVAYLDKKTDAYYCSCCGTGPLAVAW